MTQAVTEVDPAPPSDAPATASPEAAPVDRVETVIDVRSTRTFINFGELWKYRELMFFLMLRDIKVRYKQTALGAAWAVIQPFMMMLVFTVFLGRMAKVPAGDVPYPLFVFAGLLPWSFFATAIANAGNSVVGSEKLITKIYFPRLAIPFASVGAAVIDFLIAFGMLLAMMAYFGVAPGWGLLLVPLILMTLVLTALGVGTLLAALNVSYRDFRYVIPFLVQLWMFATPTVYMHVSEPKEHDGHHGEAQHATEDGAQPNSVAENSKPDVSEPKDHDGQPGEAQQATDGTHPNTVAENARPDSTKSANVPEFVKQILRLNPLTGIIGFFRAAVLGDPLPWHSVQYSIAGSVLIFVVGCLYFRRVEGTFADII